MPYRHGTPYDLIAPDLSDRAQIVQIEKKKSRIAQNGCGVPQKETTTSFPIKPPQYQ